MFPSWLKWSAKIHSSQVPTESPKADREAASRLLTSCQNNSTGKEQVKLKIDLIKKHLNTALYPGRTNIAQQLAIPDAPVELRGLKLLEYLNTEMEIKLKVYEKKN